MVEEKYIILEDVTYCFSVSDLIQMCYFMSAVKIPFPCACNQKPVSNYRQLLGNIHNNQILCIIIWV